MTEKSPRRGWRRGLTLALAAFGAAGAAVAAPAAAGFEKAPAASVERLKVTRGKVITAGAVFVNGHFLKPPYRVSRYGNVIVINNTQVSPPLVPWASFLNAGAPAAAKPASPADGAGGPALVSPAYGDASLDDLFDDDPKPRPKPKARAARAAAAEPSGTFVENARTQALLKRMNDYRTTIDARLRRGEACFFGTRYAFMPVDRRLTTELFRTLPESMRAAADAADLWRRLREQGAVYMTPAICEDLIRNRQDFPELEARRRKMREDAEIDALLGGGK